MLDGKELVANEDLFHPLEPLREIRQRNHAHFAPDALRRADAADRDAAFGRLMRFNRGLR